MARAAAPGYERPVMQRFWSALAVAAGRHAFWVAVVGTAVTLVLALGISQLEFQTDQDSYLNRDDRVYVDNVEYQDLFGGQAMLSAIVMDEGHTVDELFTGPGRAEFERFHDALAGAEGVHAVITPPHRRRVRGRAGARRERLAHR